MAGLEPSPGVRTLMRVLLVLAFAVLLLGTLASATYIVTDNLVDTVVDDITEPPSAENTTTTQERPHPGPFETAASTTNRQTFFEHPVGE